MGTLILNKEEDKRRETITVNVILAVKIFISLSAVQNMIHFIYFNSFIFIHRVSYELRMACSPVGLISSMDSGYRKGYRKAHGSIPNQA